MTGSQPAWMAALADVPHGGRTRLAPTPSGYLHTGNAVNFLVTAKLASALGASVVLRIDDLDTERVRPEYVDDIFRSLEWLGIGWDEGPSGPDDLARSWSQQHRVERYHELGDALRVADQVYGCTCSRRDVREISPDGAYPGTCRERRLSLDAPGTAWRLKVDASATVWMGSLTGDVEIISLATLPGDPVVRQRALDGSCGVPAYQLASLADDVDMGITFVVRGADLLPSTACQLHIAELLGVHSFLAVRFLHHRLLLDGEGHKLSKSEGATSLKSMREANRTPHALSDLADEVLMQALVL